MTGREEGEAAEEGEEQRQRDAPPRKSSNGDVSLSVAETNALRKKLGLAPLKENKDDDEDDADGLKQAEKILREREAQKVLELQRTNELREKLNERKAKKLRDADQMRAKLLYEGEGEEEDAKAWVQKSRNLKTKKKRKGGAKKTGDDIGSRYEEEEEEHMTTTTAEYTEKDLAGLRVDRAALEHVRNEEGASYDEGEGGVVLTLADKSILDSDSEDELENVHVAERERNLKNKKLAGKGNKKDDIMREDEDELTGLKEKKILSKYDDEYGEEDKDERFMTLDGTGGVQKDAEEIRKQNARELKLRMAGLVRGELISAEVSKTATQTDAYTKEEEELMKFNSKKKKKGKGGKEDKPKKMRKKKKKKEDSDDDGEDGGFDVTKLEGDELAKEANAAGTHRRSRKNGNAGEEQPSRDDEAWAKAMDKARDNVDEKILADLAGDRTKNGEEEPLDFAAEEEDDELERALATARETKKKTKEKKIVPANGEQSLFERIAKLEREKPTDMNADNNENTDKNLALTDVAEFCRGVGVDMSGGDDENNAFVARGKTSKNLKRKRVNHVEEDAEGEEIDWEKAREDKLPDEEDEDAPQIVQAGDGAVDVKMEDGEDAVKQEEKPKTNPARRNIGLAGVLQDMKAAGQLADKEPRWSGRANDLKDHHDRKRVLEASGVIEEQDGKPSSETRKFNFKLDKYDEFGRTLTPKEAFRELCWKFHGKAPGAKAKEKRLRKYEEEQNALRGGDGNKGGSTIERMQAVQKTTGDSFVVLSGKISEGQRRNAK